jgi:sigma-E factor negative regulatory protein RseA
MMSTGSGEGAAWREQLSALVDGELDDAAPICARWREDAGVRETWHCYQLIGDVLRSDDLAGAPARDAALLRRLRERLAGEPVVLAPAADLRPPAERRAGWPAVAAIAGGFIAVAGVYTALRPAADGSAAVARATPPALVANADAPAPRPASQVAPTFAMGDPNVRLARDARLDAYLAAHKQFAGSSAVIPPPVYNVTSPAFETTVQGR